MSSSTPCPDVVLIGGGIAGASIAFQLSKRGRRVLVLERDLLGCGSTGRAAGLLGQVRKGLYHCAGFSGHGIVRSPAIGLLMADLILDGKTTYDLEQLRADRYHDLPGFKTREEIKERGRRTHASYYGGKKAAVPT
jgi:glycine/D-amino acid oxidase-like deaminating enzyme